MSFDEFHATENRRRAHKEAENAVNGRGTASTTNERNATKAEPPPAESRFGMEDFLEMHEIQMVVVGLLLLDLFACFAQYAADAEGSIISLAANSILLKLFQSLTSFTVVFFALEMMCIVIVFHIRTFGHIGYTADLAIVGYQLYMEMTGGSRACRILHFFRFWRLIRLFHSFVQVERDNTAAITARLDQATAEKAAVIEKLRHMETTLQSEQEARVAVEEMLQTYKEEVDTLNEALKIAAMDIAEVAQADEDIFSSDEDESYLDAAAEKSDMGRKREELYREARKEEIVNKAMFVVNKDGTFEHK